MSQDIFYYSIMLLSPPLCCQILYVSALWTPMFHMEFPYILKICFISKPTLTIYINHNVSDISNSLLYSRIRILYFSPIYCKEIQDIPELSYNLFMYIDFADLYLLSVIFFQHKKAI